MEENIEQKFSLGSDFRLLRASWIIGALVLLLQMVSTYWLAPQICQSSHVLTLYVWTWAMLLLAASGICISLYVWSRFGVQWPGAAADVSTRTRFMSVASLLINGLAFFIVAARSIPVLLLGACL